MIIAIGQGESLNIEVTMAVESLAGATTNFAYKDETGTVLTHDCVIEGLVIKVLFTPLETSTMLGWYDYELKVADTAGNVDIVQKGKINVAESINPTFGIV